MGIIFKYDVFLSFRGEDTRRNFVSHLYAALSNVGLSTFLDDDKLDKGELLQSQLWDAIEGSHLAIVVFSKNYAKSSWCVHELVKIMEHHRGKNVLPVFYDVDPSDVRHQKGAFAEGYEGNGITYGFEIGSKRAFTEAANLVGWDVRNCRNDSEVVDQIVHAVLAKLDNSYLPITDYPVGLDCHVEDVIEVLQTKSTGVGIVGIWGMGGVGKTTVAKAIYNKIHRDFVGSRSFLENIREVWEKDRGNLSLQEQLLSDILKTPKAKVHSIERGKGMIKTSLCCIKALVVLDDVSKLEQLSTLCGNFKWLYPGSVVIVTTRDVRILNVLKVDYVHRMTKLDENRSLELFSWHCFREASPIENFIDLSRNVVTYCGGLPLALEVLGSYLYERTEEEWQCVLSKLKRIPNDEIQEKLKISFDGLKDQMEKDLFLDICCFFIGKDRTYVTQILSACGLHAEIGITILIERSLIKVEKNDKLGMHDLLRDMGREIVRQSSPKKPEKRSRLWFHEDVLDVLQEHTGTKAVEGLALKLQRASKVCFSTKAFEKMKRLKLLQLDHVQLSGDYDYLSKQLRWVYWKRFPLKYIPDNFYQGNVVTIELKHSNLKLVWKEPRLLGSLRILNLSHSWYLTNTPDFSKLPSLEKLILKDCPSLSEVHPSIGDLCNIVLIDLKNCTSLRNLPRTIYKLKSLKILILSGCSKIDKLEEDIVQMQSLTTLTANNTSIKQVPFSLVRAKNIAYISLCGYEGLARDTFPSLIWSWMSPTTNLVSCIQPYGKMSTSLVSMDVQNNNLGDLLPMLSELSKLRSFSVQCCSEFQLTQGLRRILDELRNVSFAELEMTSYESQISENSMGSRLIGMGSYHQVLNIPSERISEGLTSDGSSDFSLPSDNYPHWVAYTSEGDSVPFQVPEDSDCGMKGMILCVVYSSTPQKMAAECLISVLIINHTKCTIQIYKRDTAISFNDEDWQGVISNVGSGDNVEISVAFGNGLTVKKTAAYLIYSESITESSSNLKRKWSHQSQS